MTQLFGTFAEVSVAIIPVSQNTFYDTDHCIHQITSHPPSGPAIMSEPMVKETLSAKMTQNGKLSSALFWIRTRNASTFHFL